MRRNSSYFRAVAWLAVAATATAAFMAELSDLLAPAASYHGKAVFFAALGARRSGESDAEPASLPGRHLQLLAALASVHILSSLLAYSHEGRGGGEHATRLRIMQLLERHGYLHFNELWRLLGIAKAALSWHLSKLEQQGLIGTLRYKRYLLIYPRSRGVDAVLEKLARSDKGFCRLVAYAAEGLTVEEAARRLRVSVDGIREVYRLIAERLELLLAICSEERGGRSGGEEKRGPSEHR